MGTIKIKHDPDLSGFPVAIREKMSVDRIVEISNRVSMEFDSKTTLENYDDECAAAFEEILGRIMAETIPYHSNPQAVAAILSAIANAVATAHGLKFRRVADAPLEGVSVN